MTTLLIDADEYLFKACAAVEKDIEWDEQNHVLMANENEARKTFYDMVIRVADRFNLSAVNDVILCFSDTDGGTPNFRLSVDPEYKASRKGARKPLCYYSLRDELKIEYASKSFPGLEADDVMGILATKPGASCIIVSQDKDMKTIPGQIWTGEQLHVISEEVADYYHMIQTLTGDSVDGFKGCPGIGPVKAEKILNCLAIAHWSAVVQAFENAGLTADDALRNARLARILRWDDWDKKKKEPILWTPEWCATLTTRQ